MAASPQKDGGSTGAGAPRARSSATGGKKPASGRLARAQHWMLTHRLATVLIASCLSIVTITCLVLWLATITPPPPSRRPPTPLDALSALDRGDDTTAARLAERFRNEEHVTAPQRFISPYVLGMLVAKQAATLGNRPRIRQYALAARLFDESFSCGWPDAQMADGLRTWGMCLLNSRQPVPARDVLRDALRQPHQQLADVEQLLIESLAQEPGADLDQALAHNDALIKLPDLSDLQRQQFTLERARLLVRAGRRPDAEAVLGTVPEKSPLATEAVIERANILLDHARQIADQPRPDVEPVELPPGVAPPTSPSELARRALKLLEALPESARTSRQDVARISLLSARAHALQGNGELALKEFGLLITNSHATPEGWAATFEEAELLVRQERDADALQSYLRALGEMRQPEPFRNPWFSLDDLRRRLATTFELLHTRQEYDTAVKLIEAARPLLPVDRTAMLLGSTQAAWGRALEEKARAATPIEADQLTEEARKHFRAAGEQYYKLARLRFSTRLYPDDIWEAAQNFLAGQDYLASSRMYEHFLQLGPKGRRQQALLGLAESLLGQNREGEAYDTLAEILEGQANDPAAYQARLLAAQVYWRQGEIERAIALLQQNVASDLLTPAARQWRESLWTLAHLLYDERRWSDAIPRLEEACLRWPQANQTMELTYMLAESYRQLGQQARRDAERAEATLPRQQATQRATEHFQAALPHYQTVQQHLSTHLEHPGLTISQQHMLRNCLFSRGLVQYELGRYEESIATYRNAASRYQDTAESLEALVRISACYRQMKRDDLARHTLLQAKAALNQLELAGGATKNSTYTVAQWTELLAALGTL
ncbi:MAG: tetratricopeptide repeat protein [Planctomycetes bacterium]|nr:tetratricopeptide repeat protein [Planctomycetota bacterium]